MKVANSSRSKTTQAAIRARISITILGVEVAIGAAEEEVQEEVVDLEGVDREVAEVVFDFKLNHFSKTRI